MFFPVGRLHRAVELSVDAQLRKMEKGCLPVRPVIPDRLKQSDHPLLNQIIRISANQKHCICLTKHQRLVLFKDIIHDPLVAPAQFLDEFFIRQLLIFVHVFLRLPSLLCPATLPELSAPCHAA